MIDAYRRELRFQFRLVRLTKLVHCWRCFFLAGFNWAGDSAYWLTDVSGFIHGIPCDRLGGPDDIKGMLFGNYQRNSGTAHSIWQLWDAIKIQESEMIGWWYETQYAAIVSASNMHRFAKTSTGLQDTGIFTTR